MPPRRRRSPRAPARASKSHRAPGTLARRLSDLLTGRCVILCVGNELAGDDSAGPAVAGGLAGAVPWTVVDARNAPENFLGPVAEQRPDTVLVVDAVDLRRRAGTVALLEPDRLGGVGPSTHGPAPLMLLEALRLMHRCRCVVLGIQPGGARIGAPMTPAVRRAVERVVRAIRLAGRRPDRA